MYDETSIAMIVAGFGIVAIAGIVTWFINSQPISAEKKTHSTN